MNLSEFFSYRSLAMSHAPLGYPNSLLASLMLFLGNGNMMLGRSWGTRILQLAYIAFAVITVANYTANLAGMMRTRPTQTWPH